MDYLEGLNANQREAAQTIEGPLLIIAGPGSGKTRVITHRIAHLVKTCGVNPRRILAVTFTNKAAKEMRLRLAKLLGQGQQDVMLGTFHSICARLLRIEGQNIGLDKDFVIYDDSDQIWVVKQALEDLNLDQKKVVPRACLHFISAAKSQLLTPEQNIAQLHGQFEETANRVYERYERLLAESKALDFDDLLTKTVRMLNQHPEILEKYQERYLHVLVDEFQDTNISQYQLARLLAGKYRNICVVGDPD
ncbi:MAG: AAA family ATPase, partial [Dehalococcoidia bacterium]|nr:AAA family ATPase [Dehalococcoidia bacterium]